MTAAIRQDPDLAESMLHSLARLVRQATAQRSEVVFLDVTGRVARHLLAAADDAGLVSHFDPHDDELAQSLGATLVTGCVEGLDITDTPARVRGVRVGGAVMPADAVVIAMGPWTTTASQWLPLPPVDGLKGFSITLKPETPVPAQALFVEYVDEGGARLAPEIFPRPDGAVYLCGLSDDRPLPDDPSEVSVDPQATATLHRIAGDLSSCMGRARVLAENACYRPICADALPLMGNVPGVAGAFVATGHNCWGILNAPASGAAMAELIADGESTTVDLRSFTPARFSVPLRARN